jgi:hypothetical protein
MIRSLALCAFVLGIGSTPAAAQAPASTSIKVGDTQSLAPVDWPKMTWSFGTPSGNDSAGKVVIHWFCTPKVEACTDDLARIVTMRETGNVYIVAYINGSPREAKKLDPIRESEGVGRGAVATGPGVKKLFKQLGIKKGPYSIVVDVDGKVKMVATSGDLNELDARDAMVKQAVDAIRPYTTTNDGPKTARPTSTLTFVIRVQLSPWNSFSMKTPMQFDLTAAKQVVCPQRTLTADQLKIEGKLLTAAITCTAPKGIYEARGELRFGYASASGATGLGAEAASWKFEVQP